MVGPSEPTKYFLFLFYLKCPDVGMECEVWLEKSFDEIIKVERWSGGGGGHLKSNDGYLESSLDISAFHYLVQTELTQLHKTNDGSMAICLYPTFLPQFGGDGRIIQQTHTVRARIFSLNSSLINKSSFFICPVTARTPRTFLQINCCWFLILAVIVIDSQITEEKAYKLLSDWAEQRRASKSIRF